MLRLGLHVQTAATQEGARRNAHSPTTIGSDESSFAATSAPAARWPLTQEEINSPAARQGRPPDRFARAAEFRSQFSGQTRASCHPAKPRRTEEPRDSPSASSPALLQRRAHWHGS